ncbi:RNA polymerase sigma factor [Pedococcus bigeumensis]|uniref:Sigma-70 family RNA polymerase sigma factor n=1 Tax=Pedococcus bigeumensis TaxID=433644 RepID=A0A502CUV6_9MICO|nr:sigma-70 family RNA polymerase sigma factor [Pedococcus bigeumensis]TPG17395.1 sigma-70 family RNA polymerase sigma factor [Pedococcus bigeumensis]
MRESSAAPERFTRLYEQHYWSIVYYLVRRLGDEHEARDAAAEVFTVAWRRLSTVPEDWALPWLYATAGNVLANAQRSRDRKARLLARLVTQTAPPTLPNEPMHEAVHVAMSRLSELDQEILRLSAWEDLTPLQIGQVLGCTSNAASVRLHRARTRLRYALDEFASIASTKGNSRER